MAENPTQKTKRQLKMSHKIPSSEKQLQHRALRAFWRECRLSQFPPSVPFTCLFRLYYSDEFLFVLTGDWYQFTGSVSNRKPFPKSKSGLFLIPPDATLCFRPNKNFFGKLTIVVAPVLSFGGSYKVGSKSVTITVNVVGVNDRPLVKKNIMEAKPLEYNCSFISTGGFKVSSLTGAPQQTGSAIKSVEDPDGGVSGRFHENHQIQAMSIPGEDLQNRWVTYPFSVRHILIPGDDVHSRWGCLFLCDSSSPGMKIRLAGNALPHREYK